MTHVCLQAVSTMLNVEINILSTGIQQDTSNRCVRCQPAQTFHSEIDLNAHKETVHNRKETEMEREGRIQRARWTKLRPDTRIRETIPKERHCTISQPPWSKVMGTGH